METAEGPEHGCNGINGLPRYRKAGESTLRDCSGISWARGSCLLILLAEREGLQDDETQTEAMLQKSGSALPSIWAEFLTNQCRPHAVRRGRATKGKTKRIVHDGRWTSVVAVEDQRVAPNLMLPREHAATIQAGTSKQPGVVRTTGDSSNGHR